MIFEYAVGIGRNNHLWADADYLPLTFFTQHANIKIEVGKVANGGVTYR